MLTTIVPHGAQPYFASSHLPIHTATTITSANSSPIPKSFQRCPLSSFSGPFFDSFSGGRGDCSAMRPPCFISLQQQINFVSNQNSHKVFRGISQADCPPTACS